VGFLSKLFGADARNAELADWGRTIAVSPQQREAMAILWQAHKLRTPPQVDPLAALGKDDRDYILSICSADFRPAHFGRADGMRQMGFAASIKRGFTPEQAAVITGMIFNFVGPVD
jgi:hypothetical protein